MPVPITATSGADAAGAPSGSSGGNGNHAAGPSTANSSSRRDPVADSDDDADSDIDPEHRAHLRDLPEDELQALIDEFFIRKERFDDAVAMLVHGPPGRKLGQAHPSVCASRLERELTVLAELRAARAAEDKPTEGEEFEVLMADTLAILQDDLDEEHEEASRAFTEQADEVEAAGFSVVELEAKLRANRARQQQRRLAGGSDGELEGEEEDDQRAVEDDDDDVDDGDNAIDSDEAMAMDVRDGASHSSAASRTTGPPAFAECRKCRKRSRVAALPPLRRDQTDEGSAADGAAEPRGGGSGLCHVCAAEAELDARAPVQLHHGKVLEKGASGFTGWTSGLRRTNDPSLLKKMYKAKKPTDVAEMGSEALQGLGTEGALEIDEVAKLDDGGDEFGEDGDDDDGTSSEEEGLAAAIGGGGGRRRPTRKAVRRAYEAEGDVSSFIFNRRGASKRGGAAADGSRRGPRVLPECTACRAPFYDYATVHEHPTLGVSVCLYCLQDAAAASCADTAAPGAAKAAEGEDEGEEDEGEAETDLCMWCTGNSPAAESGCLLLCDEWYGNKPCGKAVCEGCVRLNLGEEALDRMRKADPWLCFSCDAIALAPLREACKAERASRKAAKERREANEKAAAERVKQRLAKEAEAQAAGGPPQGDEPAPRKAPRGASSAAADSWAAYTSGGVDWESPSRPERPPMGEGGSELVLWPSVVPRAHRQASKSNTGASEPLPAISVASFLAEQLKPHQAEGIKFVWNAVLFEKRPESTGAARRVDHGCVLAHSMGLGKTLTLIAFLHTVLARARNERGVDYLQYRNGKEPAGASDPVHGKRPSCALVLVPKAVVTQWETEWRRWVGQHDNSIPCYKIITATSGELQSLRVWRHTGGVLIMSHDTFWRFLQAPRANTKAAAAAQGAASIFGDDFGDVDPVADAMADIEHFLLKPGPDVFVMDEAHRIKNKDAALSSALLRIETKKRILLTGTPLQNNLMEYFHMVDFVNPGKLGDVAVFKALFVEHIKRGEVKYGADDMTKRKAMDRRVFTLAKRLDNLVQRMGPEILHATLPPRYDVVLTVRLSDAQRLLYNHALNGTTAKKIFAFSHTLRRIFDHPAMLLLHHHTTNGKGGGNRGRGRGGAAGNQFFDGYDDVEPASDTSGLQEKWWEEVWPTSSMSRSEVLSAGLSAKITLTLHILREAIVHDEKVLVFSNSLETLEIIEQVLKLQPSPRATDDRDGVGWQKGLDYLRLDGTVDHGDRETMLAHFASERMKVHLFLVSTRAGGQGLNLTSASRVVLLDASWNPSNDTQAVFRSYRYGQTRPVFVYRFIAEGFEQCLYRQQVVKLQLAGRVLDEQAHNAEYTSEELKDLWRKLPPPPNPAPCVEASGWPQGSWIDKLASDPATSDWLVSIEDHDKRLEGEIESLDTLDQEDAQNELIRDQNMLARDAQDCGLCGRPITHVTWSDLQVTCPSCQGVTLLPPAAPTVKRMETPGHLHFSIHGESFEAGVTRSLLSDGGVYHCQWRGFDPEKGRDDLGPEDGWLDPKRLIKRSSTISKKNLKPYHFQWQVRVRARPQPCQCGLGHPTSTQEKQYLQCSENCAWTPWSLPSAPATPNPGSEEPAGEAAAAAAASAAAASAAIASSAAAAAANP